MFLRNFLYKFLFFIFYFFLFNFFCSLVYAADYKVDYQISYDLRNFEKDQFVNVNLAIKITNLKSDVYVSKFSFFFPDSFYIKNIEIFDDYQKITPNIYNEKGYLKIEMSFSKPNIGKNSVNNFYLNFSQKNLFKINGNIWEVVLPNIERNEGDTYKIKLILPEKTNKKISIAKPKPDLIVKNEIFWNNPSVKTIYAVFGDYQNYKVDLNYHIKNSDVFPVVKEIALPPDTLYQKIYLDSLLPHPQEVYQDEDGNYLAKYFLKPFESKKISFKGYIQVFSKPREELITLSREKIKTQKKYLLQQQKYWTIKKIDNFQNLNTVSDIYYFVVNNLFYNYNKLKSLNQRLGAEKVLENPSYAVCLEFTDLFIALAREKGIMAREINGYGFSLDPKLQPLSLNSDILHAWPEYYDENSGVWKQVDPTWEKTSGIDYFSSFDLNHIVFAIKGKSSDYPLPAGMYKISDSKDILINPTLFIIEENKKIITKDFKLIDNSKNYYQIKLKIKNQGNVYIFNPIIRLKTSNFNVNPNEIKILSLAPFEEKELYFYLEKPKNFFIKDKKEKIYFYKDGELFFEKDIVISSFFGKLIFLFIFIFFLFFYLLLKNLFFKNR